MCRGLSQLTLSSRGIDRQEKAMHPNLIFSVGAQRQEEARRVAERRELARLARRARHDELGWTPGNGTILQPWLED
jgi:hypothetical protein